MNNFSYSPSTQYPSHALPHVQHASLLAARVSHSPLLLEEQAVVETGRAVQGALHRAGVGVVVLGIARAVGAPRVQQGARQGRGQLRAAAAARAARPATHVRAAVGATTSVTAVPTGGHSLTGQLRTKIYRHCKEEHYNQY